MAISSRQKDRNRNSTITFCPALLERDCEEAGVGIGVKKLRRRVHLWKVREISRAGGGAGV